MITDSFDIATETYINEEDFYGKQGKMVDTCIIIFSDLSENINNICM